MTHIRYSFYYINVDTESVLLNLERVDQPVLWNKKGLFGLIPFARIKNALENWKNSPINVAPISTGIFDWHDIIPISPQIANALLGEDKDDKCTYRGKGSPKSS